MLVRQLNETGVNSFVVYLAELREGGGHEDPPWDLLTDDETSTLVPDAPELDQSYHFGTKADCANYLVEKFSGTPPEVTYSHNGLWTWLALFFFDQLCPANSSGIRKPLANTCYAFQADFEPYNYLRGYRHLLYIPFQITKLHGGEVGRALLLPRVSIHPDMMEQIAARQEFVSNRSVLKAVDLLYLDTAGGGANLKRGSTNRRRAGNVRRFVSMMQQLDLTYDLYALTGNQLIELLPSPEFDAWRPVP